MALKKVLLWFLMALWAGGAQAQDLRLVVLPEMIESGFTKHILPRFGFKARIKIEAVTEGDADFALLEGGEGDVLFVSDDGQEIRLVTLAEDAAKQEMIGKFLDWLESDPGRSALAGFPSDGPPKYRPFDAKVAAVVETVVEGDSHAGAKLALMHCGRCHVVDHRNPFGGIGSSPSFPALRGRTGWSDLFLAFFMEAPHPSFTQVIDVTEPFDPARPPPIAPIELSVDDIDAITAYVGTMEPKDLGAQVNPN